MSGWRALVEEVRAAAAERCGDVAQWLLGEPSWTSRGEMRFGRQNKISLELRGAKRGLWRDYSEGEGGDLIALVERVRGCGFREAVEWLANELSIDNERARPLPRSPTRPPRPSEPTSLQAARIWREAIDPRGTFAEHYLASRGLSLPSDAIIETIRFHPECPWGGERVPALIAAFTPIVSTVPDDPFVETSVTAIHRIRGRGHDNKRMLGPTGGRAMMLSAWWHVADTLHVCEGLETAIALHAEGATDGVDDPDAWQVDGPAHRPVWALGSAGAFGSPPVIERVRRLVIWADNDPGGTGMREAKKCAARWADSGRAVVIRCPEEIGADYADLAERRYATRRPR